MDWSLMLLSQDIPSTIEHSPEWGWCLVVTAEDYRHAVEQIRQYRAENFQWPWRQQIRHEITFDWASLFWVALICLVYWLNAYRINLNGPGMMDSQAVSRGEWWRLVTAVFLHANLGHLMANAGFGFVLLGLTMGVYGTGIGLLAALLAGVGGNVAAWLLDPEHLSLGASGMVLGCLGLLAIPAASVPRGKARAFKTLVTGIAAGLMLFLLLGSSPSADLVAHAGGFVSGLLLGGLFRLTPRLFRNTTANLVGGSLFCLLVLLSWCLALARP